MEELGLLQNLRLIITHLILSTERLSSDLQEVKAANQFMLKLETEETPE